MPAGLKRYYGKGHLHFITFSCYRRLPLLKSARARDTFVRELTRVRSELGFRLIGYVVMPEHVHLLLSEPQRGTPSTVLQKLKLRVARRLRQRKRRVRAGQMRSPFQESGEPLRAFWQARFYDFNVYSRGKKTEKLNYMHANPVKRGFSETSERLAMEQLGILLGRCARIGWHRCGVRRKGQPKTQVHTTNLGHPPCFCDSRNELSLGFRSIPDTEELGNFVRATRPAEGFWGGEEHAVGEGARDGAGAKAQGLEDLLSRLVARGWAEVDPEFVGG
jgi:putative transposase